MGVARGEALERHQRPDIALGRADTNQSRSWPAQPVESKDGKVKKQNFRGGGQEGRKGQNKASKARSFKELQYARDDQEAVDFRPALVLECRTTESSRVEIIYYFSNRGSATVANQ